MSEAEDMNGKERSSFVRARLSDKQWDCIENKLFAEREERWARNSQLLDGKKPANNNKKTSKGPSVPRKKKSRMKIKLKRVDPMQMKIKTFFLTKNNDDGYPLHLCKYHPALKEYVYVPPGYLGEGLLRQKWDHTKFCNHCRLAPCVTEQHYYDAFSHSYNMTKNSKTKIPNSVIRTETAEKLQKIHCKWFKKRYSKKRPVLTCILRHVNNDLVCQGIRDDESNSEESSDSDSEESAQS